MAPNHPAFSPTCAAVKRPRLVVLSSSAHSIAWCSTRDRQRGARLSHLLETLETRVLLAEFQDADSHPHGPAVKSSGSHAPGGGSPCHRCAYGQGPRNRCESPCPPFAETTPST